MKKILSTSLTLLLLLMPAVVFGQETGQALTVRVVTPDGLPKQGLTVTAEAQGFRETVVTNSTGYAVFRQLQPGSYDLVILMQNIELKRVKIDFPNIRELVVVAPLGRLAVEVLDRAGRRVDGIFVTLTSTSKVISTTQRTNATGYAVFTDLPFSNVSSVGGPYSVKVSQEGQEVASAETFLNTTSRTLILRSALINVNFTVLNLEGKVAPISASLALVAGNYSKKIDLADGKGSVKRLVSSDVVGRYNATLSVKLGRVPVTVYSSFLSLESDAEISIGADVGELAVKVLDPDNKPVKGVGVLVGSRLAGNFTSGLTGEDGLFSLGYLPLSSKAGDYTIYLFRGRTPIQKETVKLSEAFYTASLRLSFQKVLFRIVDYEGRGVNNAELKVLDPQTGRVVNATVKDGAAEANLFPGLNELRIFYKNVQVYNRPVEITGANIDIRLTNINFPVRVSVYDALSNLVPGLNVKIYVDGVEKVSDKTGVQPIYLTLELPANLQIDLYQDGALLVRERLSVEGPQSVEIRLPGHVSLGGGLVSVENVAAAILAAILAVSVAVLLLRMRGVRQR
jgi:hypothetical protein